MSGGMFSDSNSVNIKGMNPDTDGTTTSDLTPGGLFSEGSSNVQATRSAAGSADKAKEYAEDSQGWAVGTDTEALDGWSDTNNSKYYAEQAAQSDSDAQDASDNAQASAAAAAVSAEESQTEADRSKSWAVGPSGDGADGTDTDNAKYWSEQAQGHSDDIEVFAKVSKSWAVGDTDVGDTDNPVYGNDTDNAQYWSTQASSSASAAASSATSAAASAASADSERVLAQAAAMEADSDATAAAASATAAAASAASADSDRILAETAAASADSDRILAEAAATSADSDATLSESWAVGGTGTRAGEDTDNAKYWSEQSKSHADSIRTDSEGFGILLDTETADTQIISVDTEVIADTEWVKEHVNTNGGNVTWEDQRSDTQFTASTLEVNSSTGLEVVMVGTKAVLREYVPTPDFSISISGGQPNASWFMADTEGEVSISASHGTLSSITSATVGGSNTDVTINNSNNTVTYPVSNANGLYTLSVNASGTNADGDSQTDNASHTWRIYADYWLATNQASASAAFSETAGRSSGRFTTGNITAQGYTFLTVSKTEFPTKFQFRTSLGGLDVQDPTTITVTINGIEKEYLRYYLGNFSHETTITVSGG